VKLNLLNKTLSLSLMKKIYVKLNFTKNVTSDSPLKTNHREVV